MRLGRTLRTMVVLGVLSSLTAACSSAGSPTPSEPAASTSAAPSEVAAATSITLWHNSADPQPYLDLYKSFTKATGIAVELVAIPSDNYENGTQTKWATGDRPDILEYHVVPAFMVPLNPEKNMWDLSDMPFVAKSGDLYKSAGAVNGKVYAAITGFPEIFGLYYNKAAFASAGVEPPKSLQDFPALCTAFKGAGLTPMYESGGSLWPTQIVSLASLGESNMGNDYVTKVQTKAATLNDPNGPFMASLNLYAKLRDDGCFNDDYATGTFEKSIDAVVNGTAAMSLIHNDVYGQFVAAAGGDAKKLSDAVGFVGVSATSPVGIYAAGPFGSYYMPKTGDAAREAAARKFIEFATGEGYTEYLKNSNSFPVMSGYPNPTDLTELQQSFKDVYDASAPFPSILGFGQFATEMGKLLNKQSTPQQVADAMQAAVEQACKAAGLPGW